jgi:hypothetical protein
MTRSFTQCYGEKEFENQRNHMEGHALDHTAGELFRRRKIQQGDYLYVFCRHQGNVHLVGRMRVHSIMSQAEAAQYLNTTNLWEASDHVVSIPSTGTIARFDRVIPLDVLKRLRFQQKGVEKAAKFKKARLDPQTLRMVRELTPASAKILDNLIGANISGSTEVERGKERIFREGEKRAAKAVVRSAGLRAAAKGRWGLDCYCCGFHFGQFYGDLGEGFAIVHHLDPMANAKGTVREGTVEEVRVVCANCHYMLHIETPAIDVDALKERIETSWCRWSEYGVSRQ